MFRIWSLFNVEPSFDPQHRFETSATLSSHTLGGLRALFSTYGIVTIIVSLTVRTHPTAAQSFSYFSNITWWGISFYQLFASYHTLKYEYTGRAPLNAWPKVLQLAHSLLFTTVVTYPFMVTIVYWALQFNPENMSGTVIAWSTVSHHAFNSVFAIFEIVFSRTERPPWIHLPCIVIMLGGYGGIAYITHETEGFYTYGFLDPTKHSRGAFAGIILGLGALVIALYVVVWFAIWARLWLTETRTGFTGPQRVPQSNRIIGRGRMDMPSEDIDVGTASISSKARYEMTETV